MHMFKVSAALALSAMAVNAATIPGVLYTTEDTLPALWKGPMYNNFISSVNGTVSGVKRDDGGAVTIPWRYFKSIKGESKNTVVVVNGFTETFAKYRELIYDFNQNGFNVLTWDHRGQGFASRLGCINPATVDVEFFNNYVSDMQTVLTATKKGPLSGHNLLLWAHSMGGGIAASHMEQFPSTFSSAVLSAPMMGINSDPYPEVLALPIADIVLILGGPCALPPGQSPTPESLTDVAAKYEEQTTTTSYARYSATIQPRVQFPEIQMAGPGARWLSQTLNAVQTIVAKASLATTPIQLHQAGQDTFVTPQGQNVFCKGISVLGVPLLKPAPKCSFVSHPTARHELWNEADSIRAPYFTKAVTFLKQYSI
ncbi:hypothetical protein PhCBS80983_g02317 [Powellomyces hirtus]|uniref:Serine aminopeptidase S33 domain-containing protein n=1 Tax=Powellomyces hirtus TaxID=109895 RepID=A0A507E755_9FUNG|nr:hypothetical protein PhCBS80983_g02317 [Powellomyces hirtus]